MDFDLTEPIAREGEQQFACILRQRSGACSGGIDFALRHGVVKPHEHQDLCDVAYALYESVCSMTGLRAKRDTPEESATDD